MADLKQLLANLGIQDSVEEPEAKEAMIAPTKLEPPRFDNLLSDYSSLGSVQGIQNPEAKDPTELQTSPDLIEHLKQTEGLKLEPYKDIRGRETSGYGHAGEQSGKSLTEEQASSLLEKDVNKDTNKVKGLVKRPLTQSQLDALVSFHYNVGETNFRNSQLLKLLNEGAPMEEVAKEFDKWTTAGKHKNVPGLVNRRNLEKATLLQDDYNAPTLPGLALKSLKSNK